jgi:hypothetical protein
MRVHRLLHETTSRPGLAALQKTDAVVDRLTSSATIIETGTESLLDYAGHPACGPHQLRQDLDRFTFLRGGSDGEEPFGSGRGSPFWLPESD